MLAFSGLKSISKEKAKKERQDVSHEEISHEDDYSAYSGRFHSLLDLFHDGVVTHFR